VLTAVNDEELIEFYRARMHDDERYALGALNDPASDGQGIHDPARVLREVEAGRKLIAAYEEASAAVDAQAAEYVPDGMPGVAQIGDVTVVAQGLIEGIAGAPSLPVFAALAVEVANRAAVYSDHPQWRPEWLVAEE
jgi:hypothetical protein